jgi:NADPH2:quinone reductase
VRAAWYTSTGPAESVLRVGTLPDPVPRRGQVRVRLVVAGVNPRDVKRRAGSGDRVMREKRVIPGDDGAGVIDMVGAGVPQRRLGQRVWVRFANFSSDDGTSAEFTLVPSAHAVPLPGGVDFDAGATLGVPAMTAYAAVFGGPSVKDQSVLVTGGAGAVAQFAIAFAAKAGARVIATVSSPEKASAALSAGAAAAIDYRSPGAADEIRLAARGEIARVIDVAFGENLPLTSSLVKDGGTVAAYASDREPHPVLHFYPLMRRGLTIQLISVFAMTDATSAAAVRAISSLLVEQGFRLPVAARFALEDIVEAHRLVEGGATGKVLIDL